MGRATNFTVIPFYRIRESHNETHATATRMCHSLMFTWNPHIKQFLLLQHKTSSVDGVGNPLGPVKTTTTNGIHGQHFGTRVYI